MTTSENENVSRFFSMEQFQKVPVIDCSKYSDELLRLSNQYKISGTPFVMKNHKNWASFSHKWQKRVTNSGSRKRKLSSENNSQAQEFVLDLDRLVADIGSEKVPIFSRNSDGESVSIDHITVERYFEDYWKNNSSKVAVFQWQFPSSEPAAVRNLCFQNTPLQLMNLDLLQYCYETPSFEGKLDSPFQYLHMGATGVSTKLHKENGGLTVTLSPLFGKQEVVVLHRDDLELFESDGIISALSNVEKFPLCGFARVWKIELVPDEILVLPAGTIYSTLNLEHCISYKRYLFDHLDFLTFLDSWKKNDCPSMRHKELLWNACVEIMKVVDGTVLRHIRKENTDPRVETNANKAIELRDGFDSLCKLRHLVNHISQSDIYSSKEMQWDVLLSDIDNSLDGYIDMQVKLNNLTLPKREEVPVEAVNSEKKSQSVEFLLDDKGKRITVGSLVRVLGSSALAKVDKLIEWESACKVHYEGFGEVFDEFILLSELRDLKDKELSEKSITRSLSVKAIWGATKDIYEAKILDWSSNDPNLEGYCGDLKGKSYLYRGPMVQVYMRSEGSKQKYFRLYPLHQLRFKSRR